MKSVIIKTRYCVGIFTREKIDLEELQTCVLSYFDLPGDYVKSIEIYPVIEGVPDSESEIIIQFATYSEALANMI